MSDQKKSLPKYSDLITPSGLASLQHEYDWLWKVERPRVTQEVSDAAKLGDRSENAEYIYGKRRLRQIDSRVRFLRKRLECLTVIDRKPDRQDHIYFGAWIELESEQEEISRYRIVGTDELDLDRGYISIDAPLARGLLGKSLDDEVELQLPQGSRRFFINAIYYQHPDWDPERNETPTIPLRWGADKTNP